jgi:hypothetical protein
VFVFNSRLHLLQKLTGPCMPPVVTVSPGGPTLGTFYVGDSGLCGQREQLTPYVH